MKVNGIEIVNPSDVLVADGRVYSVRDLLGEGEITVQKVAAPFIANGHVYNIAEIEGGDTPEPGPEPGPEPELPTVSFSYMGMETYPATSIREADGVIYVNLPAEVSHFDDKYKRFDIVINGSNTSYLIGCGLAVDNGTPSIYTYDGTELYSIMQLEINGQEYAFVRNDISYYAPEQHEYPEGTYTIAARGAEGEVIAVDQSSSSRITLDLTNSSAGQWHMNQLLNWFRFTYFVYINGEKSTLEIKCDGDDSFYLYDTENGTRTELNSFYSYNGIKVKITF